ncbi:zinc finger MYM-type protein 1-like [Sipha flava]|uniref:Zinc finger MYM-type protein 1-like n=1 Tax=Sipha flava TaxID=143950 RepID=A0A8B8G5A6_9HEMI|nr:zinc finger MYM-type protein 1-like [Sipha flava]
MELIAKFDPFLKEHLNNYGNKVSGKSNYISSHIIRELISLMADKVLNVIVEEIKNAKYFGLIVDSTPDVTHIDQLAIVLRHVKSDGQAIERFIKFIDIYSHNAEYLTSTVIETIKQLGLNIENCVGQPYDNASNMAGKYTGLQARIKKIAPAAEYLPCAAHSINLLDVRAVESCNNAVKYFSIIQTFFFYINSSLG